MDVDGSKERAYTDNKGIYFSSWPYLAYVLVFLPPTVYTYLLFFPPSDRDLLADGPVVSRPPTLCTDSPFFQTFIFSQVSRPMVDIAPAGQWRPLFFRATFLLIFVTSPFFEESNWLNRKK